MHFWKTNLACRYRGGFSLTATGGRALASIESPPSQSRTGMDRKAGNAGQWVFWRFVDVPAHAITPGILLQADFLRPAPHVWDGHQAVAGQQAVSLSV
jgi:hypothetical protein